MPDPSPPPAATLKPPARFPLKHVLAALLPVGLWAVLVKFAGQDLDHPFVFFLLPVLLASWWGGLRAGLAATLLAAFGAWDFATPATPAFDLTTGGRPVDLLGLATFLVTALLVVILQEVVRRRAAQIVTAERVARAQKESLAARDDIFNETNDLIQSVAADGRILYANRAWCETLGYTRDELPALNIFQIIHADCRDHCMATFGRLMQGENVGLIQVTYADRHGHRIELEGNVSARMENGQMVSTRGIFRNITSRRAAEKARDDIFAETNDLIQSVAADGRILYANRSWCETLGYTPDELPALNIFQIIHADCRDHCMAAFGRLMQGENIGLIEVVFTAKDGRRIELEGNVSALFEDGQMVSSRGIFRDNSQRKQAEAERQATARRLEEQSAALAALTRNPVLRGSDLPLAFRTITGAAAQTLGVSRASVWFYDHERGVLRCDDLLEMPAGTHSQGLALPLKDYPAYFAALADGRILAAHDAPADPRTREFAEGYLKPLGIASMLDATVRTQRGVAGVLCCEHIGTPRQWTLDEQSFAASLADLIALSLESAERLHAQAALRRSEEEFRTVVESSPSGIVLADGQGIITLVNGQLERDTGYARTELIGQPVEKLVPARHAAAHPGHRRHYIENPEKRAMGAGRDLAVRRKDGSEFSAEIGLAPIVTAAGQMTLASIVDVTARKQAAAALAETIGKLKRSNTELEQFAYVASHDLQEPLRAITGCVQILERGYREKLDKKAAELIQHTVAGVSRMQNLINDLLAYSRVVKQSAVRAPVKLQSAVAEARQNLETAIAESAAVITCDDLPTVSADAGQCAHLFQNLLANALKFRGPLAPAIHVSAARAGDFWKIAVRDNGIGIEPQYFDRIFTLFQRLHTRDEYPGTGLGLSICQKIVEAHGGRIWLESIPGQGTTFFFTLPAA